MKTHHTPLALAVAVAWLAPTSFSHDGPQEAVLVVTNTADSGSGSLRAALSMAANGDTVDATRITGTIVLTSGPLVVPTNTTLLGPGSPWLTVSGGASSRVLEILGSDVVIRGVTIANGSSTLEGAGIKIGGPSGSKIQLRECAVTDNVTTGHGGGIYNASGASLLIENCVIAGNRASGSGGGIFNDNGTILIAASTIRANTADLGGGIFNAAGVAFGIVQMYRSTCSENGANYGGGIYSRGASPGNATVIVESCTFTQNSAGDGSAIASDGAWSGGAELEINACTFSDNASGGATIANEGRFDGRAELDIANSIFAIPAPGRNFVNSDGQVRSLGFNLSSDDGSGLLDHATDRVLIDPLLGPLQDHGGPTLTHGLQPGSPAIDAGNANAFGIPILRDQRGLPRSFDDPATTNATGSDGTDIGALERSPSAELSKPKAKLSFAKRNTDSCAFTSTLNLGSAFDPVGAEVYVDFAGATVALTLDEKGRGATARGEIPAGSVKLTLQKRTGLWTLSANLKQGSWRQPWAVRGLINDDFPAPGHAVVMPVIVRIGDRGWVSEPSLTYTAKTDKSGSAK